MASSLTGTLLRLPVSVN
ncbi:hypothetical protein LINGRAHAP2_LOCUS17620 [Linum grandiflorum]